MSDRPLTRHLLPPLALLLCLVALPAAGAEDAGTVIAPSEPPVAAAEDAAEFEDPFDDPFAEDGADIQVADPIEPVNRAFFWFNDKLYFYLLKPVARGYRVVPEPARRSVGNFFANVATPVRFVNCLLQFKLKGAGIELGRFLLNTSVGLGGLLDPAAQDGLEPQNEDLGQTLGFYGIGSGFYLVIPVLGPSNLRDGVGKFGDTFLDPIPYALDTWEYLGVKAYDRVNAVSLDKDSYEAIKKQALDPYLFIRNAYAQRREALIAR